MRLYRPGFRRWKDDAYEHPITRIEGIQALRDQHPEKSKFFEHWLVSQALAVTAFRADREQLLPSFETVRRMAAQLQRKAARAEGTRTDRISPQQRCGGGPRFAGAHRVAGKTTGRGGRQATHSRPSERLPDLVRTAPDRLGDLAQPGVPWREAVGLREPDSKPSGHAASACTASGTMKPRPSWWAGCHRTSTTRCPEGHQCLGSLQCAGHPRAAATVPSGRNNTSGDCGSVMNPWCR